MPVESTSLALTPLIIGSLVLALRFYAREGALSIGRPSFLFATLGVLAVIAYLALGVVGALPAYAWVGFGGFGLLMALIGVWSFFR